MNMETLQQNMSSMKEIQKDFQLSPEEMGLMQMSAFEAVKEVVNNESKHGNIIGLSLLFSENRMQNCKHLVDEIVTRSVWHMQKRSSLPLLLKEKIATRTVHEVIAYIRTQYKCNSLSKLLRYFSLTQLHAINPRLITNN